MTDRDEGAPLPPVEPEAPTTTPVPAYEETSEVPPAAEPTGRVVTGKPEVGRRAIAFIIDWVVAMVIYALLSPIAPIIGSLGGAAYLLLRDGFEFDFMNGRSLGKRMMNLTVSRQDGSKLDLATSARRNWPLAIGMLPLGLLWLFLFPVVVIIGLYEIYNVLTAPDGRRWGDRLAGTAVAEAGAAPA